MKRMSKHCVGIRPSVAHWLSLIMVALSSVGPVHAATLVVSTGSNPQTNGDNFQAAINTAGCGDTVVVLAGAIYATRVTTTNSYGPQGYSFGLPSKGCSSSQFVTIQSSAVANLPSGRVSYADIPNMATLASNANAPVISYANGAGGYKWIGILFTNTANVSANHGFNPVLVDTAQGGYYGLMWPHDIIYDRVIIRPYEESLNPVPNTIRSSAVGLRLDGANMTIQNSVVAGFCCRQSDDGVTPTQSEAIGIVNGPGPYRITNNLLEAWGWNIFTGGGGGMALNTATLAAATYTSATLSNVTNLHVGDVIRFKYGAGFPSTTCPNPGTNTIYYGSGVVDSISGNSITWHWLSPATPSGAPDVPGEAAWNGVNPSNLTVTYNTLNKRPEWVGVTQCKSFWEMKAGSNVLFEGNVATGPIDTLANPPMACPINTAFALNQNGSNPWAATDNNTFRNNLMSGVGSVFSSTYNSYCPTKPSASNIVFSNNLLGYAGAGRYAFFLNSANGNNWTVTHNTVRGASNSIFHPSCTPGGCDVSNVVFRDNIVDTGSYWIQTLDQNPSSYPGMIQDHNVMINTAGSPPPPYTSADAIATNAGAVGFVSVTSADAGDDYHGYGLAATSPFKGRASDGTDPGVNFTNLDAALAGGTEGTLAAPVNLVVQ